MLRYSLEPHRSASFRRSASRPGAIQSGNPDQRDPRAVGAARKGCVHRRAAANLERSRCRDAVECRRYQTLDSKLTIIVRRPLVEDRSSSGICIRTKIATSLARSAHSLLELTDRLLGPGSRLAPGRLLPFSPIIQGRLPTKLHVAERCCPL